MDAYARYGPALVRKAERMLRSRDDALDMVHALFADLLASGERSYELPYLYRAITNRCLSWLRDERNRARLLALHDSSRASVAEPIDQRAIGVDLVAKLAVRVDDDVLETVIAHHLDGMSHDEIAELMGVSRKTVGRKLERAREALAALSSGVDLGGSP